MRNRKVIPNERHQQLHKSLVAVMKEFGDLPAEEILAISAQMTGTLVAMQDQRTMTVERAMAIVVANIEEGNLNTVANLLKPGGAA